MFSPLLLSLENIIFFSSLSPPPGSQSPSAFSPPPEEFLAHPFNHQKKIGKKLSGFFSVNSLLWSFSLGPTVSVRGPDGCPHTVDEQLGFHFVCFLGLTGLSCASCPSQILFFTILFSYVSHLILHRAKMNLDASIPSFSNLRSSTHPPIPPYCRKFHGFFPAAAIFPLYST